MSKNIPQDPRAAFRRRVREDIVKQSKQVVVKLDGFLKEFGDSEQYHGDSARFFFRNLREAVLALISVVEDQ